MPSADTAGVGRIPKEVIQRVVRRSYGRFRECYEDGLRREPKLQGRVKVRFVIARSGAVSHAQIASTTLPDEAVNSCILTVYASLTFPAPEGGIVTVVYPIAFTPG